jgi:lipid-A-disaccharide synthase
MKAPFFSLPNLLAGRRLVPEFLNEQVRPDVIGPELLEQLERSDRDVLVQAFVAIHETLRCNASTQAARAVVEQLTKHK